MAALREKCSTAAVVRGKSANSARSFMTYVIFSRRIVFFFDILRYNTAEKSHTGITATCLHYWCYKVKLSLSLSRSFNSSLLAETKVHF